MTQTAKPPKKEILKMMAGFRRFKDKFFTEQTDVYSKLATGQSPKTLIIACSDSRVDPAILFNLSPGEVFIVRNVANLVPPFESQNGFHGVSAGIEFAVVNLKVESIVILGHRQCGGIRSLFQPQNVLQGGFVAQWMTIAEDAKQRAISFANTDDVETLCKVCEKESIVVSIENLKTFPFIADAVAKNNLQLLGVYFDLEEGQLWSVENSEVQLLLK